MHTTALALNNATLLPLDGCWVSASLIGGVSPERGMGILLRDMKDSACA